MSKWTTFYRDNDFRLAFETINGYLFIHVTLDHFSKRILSTIKEKWWEFRCRAYFDGWEEIFAYTKDERMAKLIGGGEQVGLDSPDLVNLNMRMYKWALTQSALD